MGIQLHWKKIRPHRKPRAQPSALHTLGIGMDACNSSIWEVEEGGPEVQAHPWLHNYFKEISLRLDTILRETMLHGWIERLEGSRLIIKHRAVWVGVGSDYRNDISIEANV